MSEEEKNANQKQPYEETFYWLQTLVTAIVCITLVFTFLGRITRVVGHSMDPTLTDGQTVFFTRINFSYERDLVVFARMPSGSNYVKRIVAVPGDTVDIRDGALFVNGEPEGTAGAVGLTLPQEGIVEYPYTVPEDCLFLVGDNREGSVDSRSFGALPTSSIRGKLIFVK